MSQGEQPTFSSVIQAHIEQRLCDLHVALPASIVTYDRAQQKASVQPLLKRQRSDGTLITWPIVNNVPVMFPRSGKFSLTFELVKDDSGLIVISERSLDKWLSSGGLVDPADFRKFDISDAVFIPGLFAFNDSAPAEANIAKLANDKTEIAMTEDGKVRLKNLNSGEELVTVLVDLVDDLINALIRTAIGPQPFVPSTVSALNDIKSRLETLKE